MLGLKSVGSSILVILATLLVIECVARVYDWSPRLYGADAGDRLGSSRYEHNFGGAGDLTPQQDGHWLTWFRRPYHVETNAQGLRNSEPVNREAFRILALGDSQTFGPYLANEDTWPAWAENRLRRALSTTRGLQVLNAGVSGYTILDQVALLKDKGTAAQPNLVLIAVFENDLLDLRREQGGRVQRPLKTGVTPGLSKRIRSALEGFAAYSVVSDARRRSEMSAAGVDVRRGEADAVGTRRQRAVLDQNEERLGARYTELLAEAAAWARSNSIPLAVFFIPMAQQVEAEPAASLMEPVIQKAAAQLNIPFLSLVDTFRANPDAPTRYYLLQERPVEGGLTGNGHLSREGNAVIGAAVADWLMKGGLIPASAVKK